MKALISPAVTELHALPTPRLQALPSPIGQPKHRPEPPTEKTAKVSDEFWAMWLQHQDYLYHFCLKWTNQNPTEASELLSLARDKAQVKWPKYAHKVTNAKSWLSSLTKHLYIDLYRARARQDNIHSGLQKEAWGTISHQPTPEANLLNTELKDYLSQLTAALPARLRAPFILRFYQEKSYKEVAFQLGITEATGRKRIQQARTLLRKRLTRYLAGESDVKILPAMQDETNDTAEIHMPLFHN